MTGDSWIWEEEETKRREMVGIVNSPTTSFAKREVLSAGILYFGLKIEEGFSDFTNEKFLHIFSAVASTLQTDQDFLPPIYSEKT